MNKSILIKILSLYYFYYNQVKIIKKEFWFNSQILYFIKSLKI